MSSEIVTVFTAKIEDYERKIARMEKANAELLSTNKKLAEESSEALPQTVGLYCLFPER